MRENIGFIIACGLLWASVLVVGCVGDSDAGFLLALFLVPVTLIGLIVLFVIAIVRLFLHPQLPLSRRAVPLCFATVPVLLYATVRTGLNRINEADTWLTVQQYDFRGSNNFQFMKDGQYTSWRDSPLGRSAEESGRYERQDSILTLHPEPKTGKPLVFKLAIRPYSEFKRQQSNPHIKLVTLDPN